MPFCSKVLLASPAPEKASPPSQALCSLWKTLTLWFFLSQVPLLSSSPSKITPLMEKLPGIPSAAPVPPAKKTLLYSWPAAPQQKRLSSPTAGLLPLTACKIPSISSHTCCFPIRPSTPLSWFHSNQPGGSTWLSKSPPAGKWAAKMREKNMPQMGVYNNIFANNIIKWNKFYLYGIFIFHFLNSIIY